MAVFVAVKTEDSPCVDTDESELVADVIDPAGMGGETPAGK